MSAVTTICTIIAVFVHLMFLLSILFLDPIPRAHLAFSEYILVTTCKGNLAVLRKSLMSSKGGSKVICERGIYMKGPSTTDLAMEDPKRIL
jgi:hypothetical protein